jgi:UDP-glucose 4-epimerase
VTATSRQHLDLELASFLRLLEGLSGGTGDQRGALFVASSAGGVYAGSHGAPFTEASPVRPLAPYGEVKLLLEQAARGWGEAQGVPVLLGRIANLYGPGQRLGKQQGLVSMLCRAHLLREPISLYVPLDTVRDYLYAPDCGRLVADSMTRLRSEGGVTVKVIASQQAVTVGALVGELRRLFKSSPPIVYGASAASHFQARDLRLSSRVWADLDRRALTPLPVGIKATVLGLGRSLAAGCLV